MLLDGGVVVIAGTEEVVVPGLADQREVALSGEGEPGEGVSLLAQ